MSNDANHDCGSYESSVRSCIKCWVFLTLYMNGKGVYLDMSCTNFLAILYTGAFFQFIIGRMGASGLYIFISLQMFGGDGFILVYFHL